LESLDGIIKLAVPINSFEELKMGWDWFKENPKARVFLPSSQKGRWNWFRLLTAHEMPFSFFREGQGSSPDQPKLLEVLRFQTELKNWGAILGSPVKHSLTPGTHDNYFKAKKANVLSVDLKYAEFDQALPILKELGLRWAAVTSPLKDKAFELVKKNQASGLKSTNTICYKDDWLGENTDIDGLKIIAKEIGEKSVAIWGGGGTLEPIKEFLPQAQYYSSRTGQPRGEFTPENPEFIIWAVGADNFAETGVFPPEEWEPKAIIDLNYTQDSPGIECAHRYGCQYRGGLDMFTEQARKQQEFWNQYGI
ncbi:MAG: shikimate synthase, partial [Bdellovibrionales bacterium]|nr:shikimate synthase [Bdellovibrionales bacterium]